jgi:hypothetical protein
MRASGIVRGRVTHLETRLMRTPELLALSLLLTAVARAQDVTAGPWTTPSKVPPGWVVHNTRYYHVQSQIGADKAKRLGQHMELMNAVYRKMFRPAKDGAKQYTIKLFKDKATYQKYGGPPGAAAYYSWTDREMVCYDSGKWSDEEKPPAPPRTGPETPEERLRRLRSRMTGSQIEDALKMDVLGTAAHEGWHQFFDWMVGSKVELPSWIDEGVGDYLFAGAPDRTKGAKKGAAELGRMNDGRLWVIQFARKRGEMVPLEEFLAMLQRDYYSNPDVCYAQGWALCQFMLHGANGKYVKIIPEYVRLIANDSNWRQVTKTAFKGVDFAEMEREFHAYIDTLKPSVPSPFEIDAEPEPAPQPAPPAQPAPPKPPAPGRSGSGSGELPR